MSRTRRLLQALLVASLCAACHPRNDTQLRRLDRSVITRDEMLDGHYTTVYDAVAATRSMWLQPRGPDSFVLSSVVWVYVDGVRLGGVDELRTMQPRLVSTVRFYDGPSATSRWGVDNAAGVIHISTWKEGAPGMTVPDSTRKTTKPPPPNLFR